MNTKCKYCNTILDASEKSCPNCGAEIPHYVSHSPIFDPETISGSEEFDIQLIISLIKGGDAKKALEYCEKLNPALVYKYNFVRILLNANPDYLDSALDVALQDIRYCEENIR